MAMKLPMDRIRSTRKRAPKVHVQTGFRTACGLKLKGRRKAIILSHETASQVTCQGCIKACTKRQSEERT
jgi:hypothetical protein